MKTGNNNTKATVTVILLACILLCSQNIFAYEEIEFYGGVTAQIDYTVDGTVYIYDANVVMVEPAHITGHVVTGSEAVLDIWGGQIDEMLIVSTTDLILPDGVVTVYGTDFAVNGVPVDPNTTELFLYSEVLSGVYESGIPFDMVVSCAFSGNADFIHYQTIKLGWIVNAPDIEVVQSQYNLGQVDIGSTQTAAVTVYNQGNASLVIDTLQLDQGLDQQFALAPLQTLPVIEPNSAADLEITFTPVIDGIDTAILTIFSNDPNDPAVDIVLTGEGVPVDLTPEEQIVDIRDTYDAAVEEGTIVGVGNIRSARNKLRTFGKMLKISQQLIDLDYGPQAIRVLKMIEKKCDGKKRPKDFIEGPAAEELNTLINNLIDTLQESA